MQDKKYYENGKLTSLGAKKLLACFRHWKYLAHGGVDYICSGERNTVITKFTRRGKFSITLYTPFPTRYKGKNGEHVAEMEEMIGQYIPLEHIVVKGRGLSEDYIIEI